MDRCEVCGNEYELAFKVITAGVTHTFDCFECAIHKLAPICEHCSVKIVGHGVTARGTFFCSAHCAHAKGADEIVDNDAHARRGGSTAGGPGLRASGEGEESGGPRESWRGSGLSEELGRAWEGEPRE